MGILRKDGVDEYERRYKTLAKTCAYCGKPAEGNYSIHRDGFGEGLEVDLCDAHGQDPSPSCEEIWQRIKERARGSKEEEAKADEEADH